MRIVRLMLQFLLIGLICLTSVPIQAESNLPTSPADTKTDLVLNLLPGSYFDSIPAGAETRLFLEIRNQGNTVITGIRFDASMPEGWTVRFVPAGLDTLTAGSSNTIEVFMTPSATSARGVNVTFIAVADQTRAVTSAYFNIKGGSKIWLWLGLGLGVVVIAAFLFIFLRQSK